MQEISKIYYKKITTPSFKEWIFILLLLIAIFVIEIIILYFVMIPNILLALGDVENQAHINLISISIDKIVMGLGVWAILLFIIIIRLIYVVWNIENYFASNKS
ncbi:hypothetical protein JYT31_02305 [Beggiatoa alba]|nr:hypothetical protein [Beggiatoa alba]